MTSTSASTSESPGPSPKTDASPSPLAACTIVSKNYLPFARVLCESFRRHHPQGRFFLLLVDRNEGYIDPESEPFEAIYEVEDLPNLPDVTPFLFKYTILEANTAAKPFFLEHLIESHRLEKLVYFDPDILITGSLEQLSGLLETNSVVLTPHLTDTIDDDAYPGEQAILQSGTYNLGFVGLRGDEVGRELLSWWQDRLYDQCVVRIPDGLFVDQKWMDLTPGLFARVYVLTHPGYNVAYWNLHGREVSFVEMPSESTADSAAPGMRLECNGEPLIFFHFSGIRPESLHPVSKHQDRFTLDDIGQAADLYRLYANKVLQAGFAECGPWPYAFAKFDNGVPIPEAARSLYLGLPIERRRKFGNPFEARSPGSFYSYLIGPEGDSFGRFLRYLHEARLDSTFGDLEGVGFQEYADWLLLYGRHELRIPAPFLDSLEQYRATGELASAPLQSRLRLGIKRLYRSAPAAAAKALLRRTIGTERTRALKRRLRPSRSAASESTPSPTPHSLTHSQGMVIERPGINLVGYLSAETGMGEAARSLAQAFENAGIPLSLHDLELGVVARRGDPTYAGATSDFPYDVNLIVANADQVPHIREHFGEGVFAGRYNIGYWLWEQEEFPRHHWPAFATFDEIWTASSFCVDSLSGPSPIPVRRIPLPMRPRSTDPAFDRASFGFDEGVFVFTFLFNYLSHFERKNPTAVVRAFRRAFGDDPSKLLLLKTSQRDFAPSAARKLEGEIGKAENIRLVDAYWAAEKVDGLLRAADAYVSLHRSEGFGLTLAEAMWHGRPVIATAYSGVSDFFGPSTGFPVRWQYVDLNIEDGPYPPGSRWAEADEVHAAEQMRRVVDDEEERARVVERAREWVDSELSIEAVGRLLKKRLDVLLERHRPIPKAGMGRG